MTIENDFIPFAVGSGANVLSQSAYAALTTLTQDGFQAGIAPSIQLNKVWRQSSIMAAVVAQFIVAQTGQTAIDDGTTTTLLANFTTAVNAAAKGKVVLTDTGTANAYAAANPVPLTALPTATGVTHTVKIAHTNTGNSTYAPDGLATAPIYGLGGALLQGSELPANGVATLVSFVDPLLNSGNLCWVLYECVGGAQPVAPATASQHAMQLGQATGRLLNIQTFNSSGTYTPTAGTTHCRVTVVGGGASGGGAAVTTSGQWATGAGGGGGGQQIGYFAVATLTGLAVTIGAGGAAASANGNSGGTSSIGSVITAGGGSGGSVGNAVTTAAVTAGGAGGSTGSGGNIAGGNGGTGQSGIGFATGNVISGAGGASIYGLGATGVISTSPGVGGNGPGCGGSGATSANGGAAQASGAGAKGVVIIEEFA